MHDAPPLAQRARWKTPILALLVVVAAMLALRAMGRTWFCKCGTPHPWVSDIHSAHNSQHLFDPYSFSHFQHGLLFYAALAFALPRWPVGRRLVIALAVEAVWEVIENTPWVIEKYRAATISLDYYGDSIFNSVSDIATCGLGFGAASLLPASGSVAVYVAIEAVMLVTIRDSLSLNVVMLIHPFEWLKTWQSGGSSLIP